MKKLVLSVFLFSFLMIAFSCSSLELDEKQAELDRNRTLWQSRGVKHYRFDKIIPPCLCDQITEYPYIVFISNDKTYSILLETNGFDEQDFEYVASLWRAGRYLLSNTFEFPTKYVNAQTIDERFNDIQNFINNAKNDISINGLLSYQNYTINVTYNQEYGYPIQMRLKNNRDVVSDDIGYDYSLISNFQILN